MKKVYKEEIVPKLMKEFNYSTVMQCPKLVKITINEGVIDNCDFLSFSLAITIMTLGRMHTAAKKIGTRNVVRRNDFFFTRVRYSREMMVDMFLSFICYTPSVTSLMNISFILGTSSLNEFTIKP